MSDSGDHVAISCEIIYIYIYINIYMKILNTKCALITEYERNLDNMSYKSTSDKFFLKTSKIVFKLLWSVVRTCKKPLD